MSLSIYMDIAEAEEVLSLILVNSDKMPVILGRIGKTRLKASISESFKLQKRPDGTPWVKSHLSQTDPTGSPRKTLMRSTALYQDMQDDSNYTLFGDTLEVKTSVKSPKGFLYGAYHNAEIKGNWKFAGLNDKNLDLMQDEIIDYILNNK